MPAPTSTDPLDVHLTYAAPLLDVSGYAAMARSVVLGLDAAGVRVTAQPLWQAGVPELHRLRSLPASVASVMRPLACGGAGVEAAFVHAPEGTPHAIFLRLADGSLYEYRTPVAAPVVERVLALAAQAQVRRDVYVIHTPPAHEGSDFYALARAANPGHAHYVGSTMFETAGIPAGWARACNGMDELWVPSQFNRETFWRGGVAPEKIRVMPLGIDAAAYDPRRVRPLLIPNRKRFAFLSVFQWTKRKGWDVLVRAYLEAFRAEEDVTLVLRAYHGNGESVAVRLRDYIAGLGADPERGPDIVLLDASLPDALMPALYAACDVYVLPSRGEGWGMPYMEAMAMGKPTIGTRWGGNLEFMTDDNAFLIDVEGLRPVDAEQARDNTLYAGQQWAEPSVTQTAVLLRRVFEDPGGAARRGERARRDVLGQWTTRHQGARLRARVAEIGRDLVACPPPARGAGPRLRVLLQNRPGGAQQPGGDMVVLESFRRELARRGVQADVATGPARAWPYDVVHLFNFATPAFTEHCAREAAEAGVPFVVTTLYEDWSRFLRQSAVASELLCRYVQGGRDVALLRAGLAALRSLPPAPRPANAYTASRAACLLACSEGERRRLRQDYPAARRIEVLKFGADHLPVPGSGPAPFQREFGVRDFVLCVGRLETRKNQLMLLKALEHDDIPVVFVTGGFTYQPAYAELCRRLERRGPTHFLDRMSAEMLVSAYAGARLLCMPSWYELPGLVALEAARCGCAVVASRWGELGEYLGSAASYCEPDDPDSIREAVLDAYERPAPPELGARAGALGWADAAEALLGLYSEALGGEARPCAAGGDG